MNDNDNEINSIKSVNNFDNKYKKDNNFYKITFKLKILIL